MVPLLVFLVVALVVWIALAGAGHGPLGDLTLVLRVGVGTDCLEWALRRTARMGLARVVIAADEPSAALLGVVCAWRRDHPEVAFEPTLDMRALGPRVLVLDMRTAVDAALAQRLLGQLAAIRDARFSVSAARQGGSARPAPKAERPRATGGAPRGRASAGTEPGRDAGARVVSDDQAGQT